MGSALAQVNLRAEEVRTLDEVLRRIRAAAQAAPKGAWVLGRGYDHAELDVGRHPTAAELDARRARQSGLHRAHLRAHGVANSMAMKLAGVGHNTPDPEGGVIERKGGALTGLFQERAMRLVRDVIPRRTRRRWWRDRAAGDASRSLGFASATDMNVGMTRAWRRSMPIEARGAAGRLPLRMWQVLAGNPEGIARDAWEARGMRPMEGDDMPALGRGEGLRRWQRRRADGGLLRALSASAGGGTGVFTFPDEKIHALLKLYHEQGWQLDIHAIGDAAIEQVLLGMEAADSARIPSPAGAIASSIAAS
jgi:predicted amidohydrolase YtcJ